MPPSAEPPAAEREPDVRFTYANERKFLAWNRTALVLSIGIGVVAGIAVVLAAFEK